MNYLHLIHIIIYGLILWSLLRPGGDMGEKEYYDHLDRFWNGKYDDELPSR